MANEMTIRPQRTILARIGLILVLCVCTVAGAMTYGASVALRDFATAAVGDRAEILSTPLLRQFANDAAARSAAGATPAMDAMMAASLGSASGAAFYDAAGTMVALPTGVAEAPSQLQELVRQAIETKEAAVSGDGLAQASPVLDPATGAVVGVLGTSWSADAVLKDQPVKHWTGYLAAAVATLAGLAGAIWFTRKSISTPLHQLSAAIRDMSEKRFDAPLVTTARGDEIGVMSRDIETLRDSLAAGEAIRDEAAYKSAAFVASSAAMMLVDDKFRINYVNPKMADLLVSKIDEFRKYIPDFDPRSVLGKEISLFHDKANDAKIQRALAASGAATFSTAMTLGDTRLSLSINSVRSESGTVKGYVVEWADVTEDWLNRAVLEAIDTAQPRAELDQEGRFITANDRFYEAMGMSGPELAKSRLQSLLIQGPEDKMTPDAMIRHVLTERAHLGLMHLRTGRGEELIIDSILTCVRDHTGKPFRLMLVGKDVTKAQRALAAAERDREALTQQQDAVVDALRVGLRQLSNGDLTAKIAVPFAGSYEELRIDYNQTVDNLSAAVREIIDNAENIKEAARDISSTADGLSRRTEGTAATLEQTAAALGVLTASVTSAAEGAAQADRVVSEAKVNAEQSGNVVVETVSAMDLIAASSDKITSIIKVIDDIAFQTNLLALNAGVEAARAGDAGRGFAVVASEVRALAQRSSDAAREINDLIAKSGTQVKRGVELVGHTGEALKGIVASVSDISALVSEIAVSSRQQSTGLAEINTAVNELDQSTQQNAARLEEATAASEALTNDAVALVTTVSHFKLEGKRADTAKVVGFQKKAKPAAAAPRAAAATGTGGSGAMGPRRPDFEERSSAGWEDF